MCDVGRLWIVVFVLSAFSGCGFIWGDSQYQASAPLNPLPLGGEGAGEPLSVSFDFDEPVSQAGASAALVCGSFDETSSDADITAGRDCIRTALSNCTNASYLIDLDNTDGTRFVSFVAVEVTTTDPLACQLHIHTVSNDPSRLIGDVETYCSTLGATELPEFACGIGD